ncbi:LLM class F420-dependent oxidoreductase [Dactylosporangium sp. NPDC000555]|uniref:LLM class F420-dependent oxidoreductase n=1 Tax=Dactylosporangium sp. NPDC000555 TaxID=3154260 RepID=UPI00331BE600
MEIGVTGLNAKATIGPDVTVRLARRAEELGYRSWWAGEHVVLPSPRTPDSPMAPTDPVLDPLVHLAFVAAATSEIALGTAIVILPQRNPVVLAKQVASLDVLSGGRLRLGVGAGYLAPEMTAVGVPMRGRGERTDEYIDAMRSLWYDPAPVFRGRYTAFADVDAHPRPAHPIPVVIGGHSPAAFRRAVTRGDGWFGNGDTPEDLERHLTGLARAAREHERGPAAPLEITWMQLRPTSQEQIIRYRELGVDHLVFYPLPIEDPDDVERFLERSRTDFDRALR